MLFRQSVHKGVLAESASNCSSQFRPIRDGETNSDWHHVCVVAQWRSAD